MTNKLILQAQNVNKSYFDDDKQKIEILSDINLELYEKHSIAIVGSSGSGKSTLLHILAGLDMPTTGSIKFLGNSWGGLDNKHSKERNKYMGFIYQFHHLVWELSAIENAMLPLWISSGKTHTSEQIKKAQILLDKLGLSHRLEHLPSQLSGGERQRVAIARALIHNPACILADEPTGNLDKQHSRNVFNLLKQTCNEQNASLVVVTHDPEIASECDRTVTIKGGVLN
ncbi:MAG: hypothetical protein RLZZ210_1834 [Pseudomonadota bacterium]|jgi:lipoprotein-releasing system ATP-binding protein